MSIARRPATTRGSGLVLVDLPGLQTRRRGPKKVLGGFDSHTLPPPLSAGEVIA